jgi:hypothetical protein
MGRGEGFHARQQMMAALLPVQRIPPPRYHCYCYHSAEHTPPSTFQNLVQLAFE